MKKALLIFRHILFLTAIILPFAIASWLVVFRTYPLLYGDYIYFKNTNPNDLFMLHGDQYRIVFESFYYLLDKFNLWNYQYHSFISILLLLGSVLLMHAWLKREMPNPSPKMLSIWITSITVITGAVIYRQMLHTHTLVFFEFYALTFLLCKQKPTLKECIGSVLICILGALSNSHGVFLSLIAIIYTLNHIYKLKFKIVLISIQLLVFINILIFYIIYGENSNSLVNNAISISPFSTLGLVLINSSKALAPNLQLPFISIGLLLLIVSIQPLYLNFTTKKLVIHSFVTGSFIFSMLSILLVILGRGISSGDEYVTSNKFLIMGLPFIISLISYYVYIFSRYKKTVTGILLSLTCLVYINIEHSINYWSRLQSDIITSHGCLQLLEVCNASYLSGMVKSKIVFDNYMFFAAKKLFHKVELNTIIFSTSINQSIKAQLNEFRINSTNEIVLTGYASDGSCNYVKTILITHQNKIVGVTSSAYHNPTLKKKLNECTTILEWKLTLKEEFTDQIKTKDDIIIWILDPITNIAYRT